MGTAVLSTFSGLAFAPSCFAYGTAAAIGTASRIDASAAALDVARQVLADQPNVEFHLENLSNMSLDASSCDFGYSLGVLHHIPDTEHALRSCVAKLKPGAPFLVYLYYDLEGAGVLRRGLFKVVTGARWLTARIPYRLRIVVTDALAMFVYLPLARVARLAERIGRDPSTLRRYSRTPTERACCPQSATPRRGETST